MIRKKFLVLVLLAIGLASCNNWQARYAGGTQNVEVTQGQAVVNVTWKDDSLWVLTRQRRADEAPQKYEFKEYSNVGVLEGTVVLTEK